MICVKSVTSEEKKRLNGYYQRNDYTKARYGKLSMRYYADQRTFKINKLIKNNNNNNNNKVSILDVGCGTGVLLKQLFKLNNKYFLSGLDFSEYMLNNSVLNKYELKSIKLVQGSAFQMPFKDNSFDIVVCTRFIHQYTDELKKELITEMRRIINDDGIIIIEFYSYSIGLIKYIEKKFLNPTTQKENNSQLHEDFFKHYIKKKQIEKLINSNNFEIEPIVLPLHSKIVRLIGLNNFKKINRIAENIGLKYYFSQYLIVITKK